jgi:hypothetical protein
MAESAEVSVLELKRLLIELVDKRPDICVRFRLLGEMWFSYFMRIILVTDTGVILNNEVAHKVVPVKDLKTVMQFEIDRRFQNFRPHFHYNVKLRNDTLAPDGSGIGKPNH